MLRSKPRSTFRIDFYTTPVCDNPQIPGQGRTFFASREVTTSPEGSIEFDVSREDLVLTVGEFVVATATEPTPSGGMTLFNTSEFSLCQIITSGTIVTNRNNSGEGSLRQAIINANTNVSPGALDTITFDIPATEVDPQTQFRTIRITSPLPPITDPVRIDGYTQFGSSRNTLLIGNNAVLLIEIRGMLEAPGASGLTFTEGAGGSSVQGLILNGFSRAGILLNSSHSNRILGNFIGTSSQGTAGVRNPGDGVLIVGRAGNAIGGVEPFERNIISGHDGAGIRITNDITGNRIARNTLIVNNYIGLDRNGTGRVSNGLAGVVIAGAEGTTVGGTTPGARNVLSGNVNAGVAVSADAAGRMASGTLIAGNSIGTNAGGTAVQGNVLAGVSISGAVGTTVGGVASDARNIISGNGTVESAAPGVVIAAGAVGTLIAGNSIGTDPSGMADAGNTGPGVSVVGGRDTTIGLLTDPAGNPVGGAGNLISGNDAGGVVIAAGDGTRVAGNSIGTNAAGTASLPNQVAGVTVIGGLGAVIGGAPAAGNLISGNAGAGVMVSGTAASTRIAGNLIGTTISGTAPLSNIGAGVAVGDGTDTTVGVTIDPAGNLVGAGNIISGDRNSGVAVTGGGGVRIAGNLIGTDFTGTRSLPNQVGGVSVIGARGATVGGGILGLGNVISGNAGAGVAIFGGAANTLIAGNVIGTTADGSAGLPNTTTGVSVFDATNTAIGVTAAPVTGNLIGAPNIISGNIAAGVTVLAGADGTGIADNFIGTDGTGFRAVPNLAGGMLIGGARNTTVGGANPAFRNVISGNNTAGVVLQAEAGGVQAQTTLIAGNFIGTTAAGSAALGNSMSGVFVGAGRETTIGVMVDPAGNPVGGARNLISGNGSDGVVVTAGAPPTRIAGNVIGLDVTGAADLGNARHGVLIEGGQGHTIADNVISGNDRHGVRIEGASQTRIRGNSIGTATPEALAAGLANRPLGNTLDGVSLMHSGFNTIGGAAAADRNVIAGNQNGVTIDFGPRDTIANNHILGNRFHGVTVNDSLGTTIGGAVPESRAVISDSANVISNNNVNGILLVGDNLVGDNTFGTLVMGNLIGLAPDGVTAMPNRNDGILVRVGSADRPNVLMHNVISSNGFAGIEIAGARQTTVRSNYIGTDGSGNQPRGNQIGVYLNQAGGNTIGGIGGGNVISGNLDVGVLIVGLGTTGGDSVVVQGNFIGTTADGLAALGNGSSNAGGTVGIGVSLIDVSGITIGGAEAGAGNVISGNRFAGVSISGRGTGNRVVGNIIGAASTREPLAGTGPDFEEGSRQDEGVLILASGGDFVAGNHVADNIAGVEVAGATTAGSFNTIQGNEIARNRIGVYLNAARNNLLSNNTIVGNARIGVAIVGELATGNVIRQNRISGNASVGLYLERARNNIIGPEDGRAIGPLRRRRGMSLDQEVPRGDGNIINDNGPTGRRIPRNTIGRGVGIYLFDGASGNSINRNLIQGNRAYGVLLFNSAQNLNDVTRNGSLANSIARSGIANFREFTGSSSRRGSTPRTALTMATPALPQGPGRAFRHATTRRTN